MKIQLRLLIIASMLASSVPFFSSCDDDDDGPKLTGNSVEYDLLSQSNPSISGSVTFAERSDNSTLVTIQLNGTSSGNTHPAHIHSNTAAEGGGIVVDLTAVDGATGMSETIIEALNDGTAITYDELIDFNGYVNVHLSTSDLATLVAQGDIGQNALTGQTDVYPLGPKSNPGISGTATFAERANGATLITIELDGTSDGGDHPAHIHMNSASEGGPIVIDLTNVNGGTGISRTNVTARNDDTAITYDELVAFDGYINVHLSSTSLSTLIAQGNIGANAN